MGDPGKPSSSRRASDEQQVDSFSQVNAQLIDRGCLTKPLDVEGLSSSSKKSLASLLVNLLTQRQEDASFREQLTSKVKVAEASLERTKRFWSEEQSKSGDLARRLETTKAKMNTSTQELTDCQATLKRTKEELQKAKRDLLAVKQQAHQQKQAGERQLERLRTRFTDESIKLLRAHVPDVRIAAAAVSSSSASSSTASMSRRSELGPSRLERKQIDELEIKRAELIERNTALKRYATESLNLAREATQYLEKVSFAQQREQERIINNNNNNADLGSSTATTFSSSTGVMQTHNLATFYQRDLFPPSYSLQSDYTISTIKGRKQHPALDAFNTIRTRLQENGSAILQSLTNRSLLNVSSERTRLRESTSNMSGDSTLRASVQGNESGHSATEEEETLDREGDGAAWQRVQELEEAVAQLEREKKEAERKQSKEEREERMKQIAEVEKQRQRYLSLCKELEKQEEALRMETEALQRDREELLKMEMSLSMQAEESNLSLAESDATISSTVKRDRDEEKENVSFLSAKRARLGNEQGAATTTKSSTPKENTMRFVTMRKQRLRLQ